MSVDSSGAEADGGSVHPAISADGRYVAFSSGASNLVAHDTNGVDDVFVRDTVTGTTTRVSVDSSGAQADADSGNPAISADGRYVAFESQAFDHNDAGDVFVRDLIAGTTALVSVNSTGGTSPDGGSVTPAISADGRYVAFASAASDLVAGDTNDSGDVFVRDLIAGTTTRVSVDSTGAQADVQSGPGAAISADGRYVAFRSYSSDLVPGDTNGGGDVFMHDTVTGTTTRVSVDSTGNQANGLSGVISPAISANGRYIAFDSLASNLVDGDTNASGDVFVHDTVAGTTTRISVGSSGAQSNHNSGVSTISADGRYVAFASDGSNLVAGDTNGLADVFVRDTAAGTTTRVSADSAGAQANGDSTVPAISADGRYVAFTSEASNLVAGDGNASFDIFVRANPQPIVTGVAPATLARGATTTVTVTGSGFLPGFVGLSADGIEFANVTVVSPTELTADATVVAGAATGARNLWIFLAGTGPGPGAGASGICASCLSVS